MPTVTSPQLIEEAKKVLDRAEARGSFNREEEAKVNQLLKMADLVRATEVGFERRSGPKSHAQLFNQRRAQIIERTTDPAVFEFFGGKRSGRLDESRSISITGGRIQEHSTGFRWNGKPIGAITELRDFSAMMPETRTYTGLFEGSGGFGGYTVPFGYIPQVFAALKRTSQILEAAN